MLKVSQVFINHFTEPIGISEINNISWKLESDRREVAQDSYRIKIWAFNKSRLVYDSDVVKSRQSVNVKLDEPINLMPLSEYLLELQVKDNYGDTSEWKTKKFLTSLLNESNWRAKFIGINNNSACENKKSIVFKKIFKVDQDLHQAYLLSTAYGVYHVFINGKKVGDDELAPGWTSYTNNLLYQIYDVKKYIREGVNTITAYVGAGWFKSSLGWAENKHQYGKENAFSSELRLKYTSGKEKIILTSEDWKAKFGAVTFSDIYDGEIFDENLSEKIDAEDTWESVKLIKPIHKNLYSQAGSRIKIHEKIKAINSIITPKGEHVIDFGQNLTGFPECHVHAKAGEEYILRCFEVLDKNGNVYLENLRGAKAQIKFIASTGGKKVIRPYFTFQGFRYIWLEKWDKDYSCEDFSASVVYSDMETIGSFICSNPLINRLYRNIVWGMKGNFLDIPTDCPQRDERLGWTGDAQIFCSTAAQIMDVYPFFKKWLRDLASEQFSNGGIPHVIPDILTDKLNEDKILQNGDHSAAGWSDAAVIIPWTMYTYYGDKDILIDQYESMKSWIDFMSDHSQNGTWSFGLQYGDWVALDAEEGSYFGATPNELICAAYYAYSTELFVKTAKVLNRIEDYRKYKNLHDCIKKKYIENYFDSTGHLKYRTQTAQILTLFFNLVPEQYKSNVVEDLVELLKSNDGHLLTGFLGTPYFCFALSQNGHLKEAYDLLLKEDYPSWLYQVKMGATTIWEHWDGIKPDGSMWSPDMNSFNHYAYGAIADWMFKEICGIAPDENKPGFEHFYISPQIGSFEYAEAKINSNYGLISSRWEKKKDGVVSLKFIIPVNTSATVQLSDCKEVLDTSGIEFLRTDNTFKGNVKSGTYEVIFNNQTESDNK